MEKGSSLSQALIKENNKEKSSVHYGKTPLFHGLALRILPS